MKTNLMTFMALLVAVISVETKSLIGEDYAVIDLGTLGGQRSMAYGINASGQVVGSSYISGRAYLHAFLYSNGSMIDLGTLGGNFSQAKGINKIGQIIGQSSTVDNNSHAFLYSNGSMIDLGTLGGCNTSLAYGINDRGQIVGQSSTVGNAASYAFLYSNGSMINLGTFGGDYMNGACGINSIGQIVGYSSTVSDIKKAFLYSDGLMTGLGTLGESYYCYSYAAGVNNNGQVIGGSSLNDGWTSHAFLYSNGSMIDLGTLGGNSSWANGINSHGQVVGASYTYENQNLHAFLYSNGSMVDLNNLILNQNSNWILTEATAVNDSGQIVGKGIKLPERYIRAFRLDPLPNGWRENIEKTQMRPTYGNCPAKEPGKDSLIVVTHGWIPPWNTPEVSTTWVNNMTNDITQYLTAHSLNNWQVIGYKWVEKATTILPDTALNNAVREGGNLGKCFSTQNWNHIHFIAHSAGSALIQTATDVIKDSASGTPPGTIIHTTFLDAYVGLVYGGKSKYGLHANWSDSYFSRDKETLGEFYDFTQGPLDHCYNVDVTWLDSNKSTLNIYYSSENGNLQSCLRTITSHTWPHEFYVGTIPPVTELDSQGFGFLLSEEADGWSNAINYVPGNDPPQAIGIPDPPCTVGYGTTPAIIGPTVDFMVTPSEQSSTGLIIKANKSINLVTGSPVWLATFVAITNTVNVVSFDAEFTSTNGAQGLLSVFWDTNTICSLDERTVLSGLRSYVFTFPRAQSGTTHILGFRLDSFTNIQSSINLTNVSLGFFGVTQPFSLSVVTNTGSSLSEFKLTGQSGFNYTVEVSTNLVEWSTLAVLVNSNGTVHFRDPESTNAPTRFYRAVAP